MLVGIKFGSWAQNHHCKNIGGFIVAANKKLTFCFISMIVSMSIRSVSLSFRIVRACTHHLFLHSHERLIGRCDHTVIIACSPCRVEEAIF